MVTDYKSAPAMEPGVTDYKSAPAMEPGSRIANPRQPCELMLAPICNRGQGLSDIRAI